MLSCQQLCIYNIRSIYNGIKSADDIFMFDSHARNCFGMPDSNGSAVVMKCTDIKYLEQYLHQLSFELACETFEIVPVEFYTDKNFSPTKTKRCIHCTFILTFRSAEGFKKQESTKNKKFC